ncbi:MAG TPA: DMT family transporter [Propionibacteriaceae bacterium]
MLFVALAGISGLVWGVGDFAGGKATQRAAALPVAWLSKVVSLPLLALYLIAMYVPPHLGSLVWGALGGCVGIIGMMLFYQALSAGAMTVVAPIAAVTSAAIPVIVGLASGERPGALRLVGVGCALAAITLVSLAPKRPGEISVITGRLIGLAVGSGVSFALFFISLARASDSAEGQAGLWPIAASQSSALVVGAILLAVLRPGHWPKAIALRWTLVAGPIDMTANAIYLLATKYGDLSLVAPLAALYPVTTVILALVVDHERVRTRQVVGLVLALVALLLVSR